jgi:hypothetical protein
LSVVALAVVGVLGAGPAQGTVEALTGGLDVEQETAGPVLDPTDPNVDPSKVFAVRKDTTTPAEATEQVEDAADALNVESETEVTQNLGPDGEGTVVVVDTDPSETADMIDAMVNSGLYSAVDYEWYAEPTAFTNTPNDPGFTDAGSWGLKAAPGSRFNEVWAGLAQAPGDADSAPVAVIDTGFDLSHIDFGANVVPGWDWAEDDADVSPCLNLDAQVSGASEPAPDQHGTFVAGIVGATPNNATSVVGAGWETKVILEKVAQYTPGAGCLQLSSTITSAINGAVTHGAKVINMSFGSYGALPAPLSNAIQNAANQGVVMVAGVGNDALGTIMAPASYESVISVASTNTSSTKAYFSNWSSGVDLSAPGESSLGMAVGSDSTRLGSGTSFSAPLVASAVALLLRYRPWLTPAQLSDILATTSQGTWKILDVRAAVDLAKTATPGAVISASRNSVTLSGLGSGSIADNTIIPVPVTVTTGLGNAWSLTNVPAWLTVSPAVGESGTDFTVSASANYGDHRSAQFIVAAPGSRPVLINVSQGQTFFPGQCITVSSTGGIQVVDIRPTDFWQVSSSNTSWLAVAPWDASTGGFSCYFTYQCTNGNPPVGFSVVGRGGEDLAVLVATNHGPERAGTITWSNEVLTVIQEAGS